MSPSVTIVLPTYNGMKYLKESVDSCLQQTFEDFELIIIVDGSTDETVTFLKTYIDKRLRVIVTKNQGQGDAMLRS